MRMSAKRWGGISVGIILALLLYGCLTTKAPQITNGTEAQAPEETRKTFIPILYNTNKPSPSSPPLASDSIYITSLDSTTLFNQGCALGSRDLSLEGKQDSLVILHFGYPRMVNNEYGARLYYPASPATVDQIASAVIQFGHGYWYCVGADFDSHLRIGIGTSNYGGSIYSLVTAGHGQAWARMVNQVNDWFLNSCTRSCDGQVDAVGASDIELDWSPYETTLDWLVGYDSANNSPLYNFGAIPGCPYLASPTARCGGGYSLDEVWMVTYGMSPVWPVPEIYRTDGVNAQQWYLMSVYSYVNHGVKMQFIGPMSQYQACLQRGGCNMINNKPEDAWTQLYTLLNGDERTAGETLPYLTDIFWLNEPFPSVAGLQPTQAPGNPPASKSPIAAVDEDFSKELQSALQSEQLSDADRARIEEKLQLTQQLSSRIASAPQAAKPGSKEKERDQALLPAMAVGAALSSEEEILEGSEGVLRAWEASIQNSWEGQRNGGYYQVLAGASVEDASQGLLLVIETRPESQARQQQIFLSAEKSGALRIIGVQGTKVLLSAANGGRLTFDLSTGAFQ